MGPGLATAKSRRPGRSQYGGWAVLIWLVVPNPCKPQSRYRTIPYLYHMCASETLCGGSGGCTVVVAMVVPGLETSKPDKVHQILLFQMPGAFATILIHLHPPCEKPPRSHTLPLSLFFIDLIFIYSRQQSCLSFVHHTARLQTNKPIIQLTHQHPHQHQRHTQQ